jgi:hypothetical protein
VKRKSQPQARRTGVPQEAKGLARSWDAVSVGKSVVETPASGDENVTFRFTDKYH